MRSLSLLPLLLLALAACAAPEPQPPETHCLKVEEQEPIDGGFGGTGQSPTECQPETPL